MKSDIEKFATDLLAPNAEAGAFFNELITYLRNALIAKGYDILPDKVKIPNPQMELEISSEPAPDADTVPVAYADEKYNPNVEPTPEPVIEPLPAPEPVIEPIAVEPTPEPVTFDPSQEITPEPELAPVADVAQ